MVRKGLERSIRNTSQFQVNGSEASLDALVKEGDRISYQPGTDGTDARIFIKDLMPLDSGMVWVNGEELPLTPTFTVNGQRWDVE